MTVLNEIVGQPMGDCAIFIKLPVHVWASFQLADGLAKTLGMYNLAFLSTL
jgi:hypothetical protein